MIDLNKLIYDTYNIYDCHFIYTSEESEVLLDIYNCINTENHKIVLSDEIFENTIFKTTSDLEIIAKLETMTIENTHIFISASSIINDDIIRDIKKLSKDNYCSIIIVNKENDKTNSYLFYIRYNSTSHLVTDIFSDKKTKMLMFIKNTKFTKFGYLTKCYIYYRKLFKDVVYSKKILTNKQYNIEINLKLLSKV